MWRAVLFFTLFLIPTMAAAAPAIGEWSLCHGGPGPVLTNCWPLTGRIDPQGRELWLRAPVTGSSSVTTTLTITAAASSEVWFNGARIGANGQPGGTAAAERPGRYEASFPLEARLWRPDGNQMILRLSAFHTGLRLAAPVSGIMIGDAPGSSHMETLAVTFAVAGALLSAAFVFGAIYWIRRTGSSLMLAAMALVAALQAVVENFRYLVRYDYPLHAWRLGAIWLLAALFALLLVSYSGARFAPRRRGLLTAIAAPAACISLLAPGFDFKTGLALMLGVLFAGFAAGLGMRQRIPGATAMLLYLAACLGIWLAAPGWFLDLSFFVLAASLTLPLLVADVVRLGRSDAKREAALTRAISQPNRLTVATARGVELISLSSIIAILGADDYAELRLQGGRGLLHDARMDQLESQLPPGFLRVHRSVIVNLAHVSRLERDGARWRLHMAEGAPLAVSRARLASLRQMLGVGES